MILIKMAIGREIQPPAGAFFPQERIANCIKLAIILVNLIGRIQEGSNGLAGIRTQGLRLAKAALYQLSYKP
jgi:hypothetical protein